MIPVWEVPGYSQLGYFTSEALKTGNRWVLKHSLEAASKYEMGAASSRELCGGVSKGRVCFTTRGLRAGVYAATTTYDRVGLIREVRWRERWEVAVEWMVGRWGEEDAPWGWQRWVESETFSWAKLRPNWGTWEWREEIDLVALSAFPTRARRRCLWAWMPPADLPPPAAVPMAVGESNVVLIPQQPEWWRQLRAHWECGGVVVLVTDGSLIRRYVEERRLQVSHWMGIGWALGLAAAGSEEAMAGDEPGHIEWIHTDGVPLREDPLVTASSFFSESAALAVALRRVMAAMEERGGKWGALVHMADNEGLTQVVNKWDCTPRKKWRKKAGQAWWAEIRGRVRYIVTQMGRPWRSYWIRGHPERRKKPDEFHAVDWGSVSADAAASPAEATAEGANPEPGEELHQITRMVIADSGEPLEEGANRIIRTRYTQIQANRYLFHRLGGVQMDWQGKICWDWRIYQRWTEPKRIIQGVMQPVGRWARRSDGWMTIFRAKLWWGMLLSEAKRARKVTRGVEESRYLARMKAGGWPSPGVVGWQGEGPVCSVCKKGRVTLKCEACGKGGHKRCWAEVDLRVGGRLELWCQLCLQERELTNHISPPSVACSLCREHSQEGGTAWHVMGRCLHPTLTAERRRVWSIVRRYMEERESEHKPEVWAVVRPALEVDQEGRWNPPTGWEEAEPRLDGRAKNPWYGLFPPEWREQIFANLLAPSCSPEGKLSIMEEIIRELRKLGDMCVMACGEMWTAACALWCESEGEAKRVVVRSRRKTGKLQRGRGSLAEARMVALADLQGPQSGTARGLAARARAAWRAGGERRGLGGADWDDAQWLVRSRADAAQKRRREAAQGDGRVSASVVPWIMGRQGSSTSKGRDSGGGAASATLGAERQGGGGGTQNWREGERQGIG